MSVRNQPNRELVMHRFFSDSDEESALSQLRAFQRLHYLTCAVRLHIYSDSGDYSAFFALVGAKKCIGYEDDSSGKSDQIL
jgi:hypothetical protein